MLRPPLRRLAIPSLAAALLIAAACKGDDPASPAASHTVTFKATLSGANEIPANASTGTGSFTATLDTVTNLFIYDVTFSGLSGTVTSGHIHGPATAAANAGAALNFATWPGATFTTGVLAGTAHGMATLTAATQITATVSGDSLKKLLFAGLTYANVHTSAFAGGEVRGQITRSP
ncbi:MAG: CHRD domain-containing protein [Gemmatimonadetes bacterium]|nr:CHRD domain-containing protein [Gemmatimonadota bacterium]